MNPDCSIGSIRWVEANLHPQDSRLLNHWYYFINETGYPAGVDRKPDDPDNPRYTASTDRVWYCLDHSEHFMYWNDVERHVEPEEEPDTAWR